MSWLTKLFGGGSEPAVEVAEAAEDYKGFRIVPEPIAEGSVFRLAARIEQEIGGEVKISRVIRADTLQTREQAVAASLAKARQVIDERGAALFR